MPQGDHVLAGLILAQGSESRFGFFIVNLEDGFLALFVVGGWCVAALLDGFRAAIR